MAKKVEDTSVDFVMDTEAVHEAATFKTAVPTEPVEVKREPLKRVHRDTDDLVSCLRDTIITVQHVPQANSITDPKHVLYGGMAETAIHTFSVPRLRSGVFADPLTKEEKAFLEAIMGLEEGSLSVYKRDNNYWSNSTPDTISTVRLGKQDTRLNLNDPQDYIRYKILLANKDKICPDIHTLRDRPKATYQFVLVSDTDVSSVARTKMATKKQCYMEYGKIEDNAELLKAVVEILTGKPLAKNTKLEFLQTKVGELIEADSKTFLGVVKDPLLPTRILIKKAVEQGFISKRNDFYYLREDNSPLCEGGEESTFTVAAKFLANPKRQTLKMSLEAKVK